MVSKRYIKWVIFTTVSIIFILSYCSSSSEKDEINNLMQQLINAANSKRASTIYKALDKDFMESHGLNKEEARRFLIGFFLAHPNLEVTEIHRNVKIGKEHQAIVFQAIKLILDKNLKKNKKSKENSLEIEFEHTLIKKNKWKITKTRTFIKE